MNPIDEPDAYRQTQLEQDAHVLFEVLDDCSLQPVVANGKRSEDTKFMWNSLTEQTPPTPRYVLDSIARLMLYVGSEVFTRATRLSSEEDRGAILASAIQQQLPEDIDLPMGLSRCVTQPKDDRPAIPLIMEFAATRLHFDGITKHEPKEQLAVVDDLISTGGTMNAQTHGIIEQTNHNIVGVVLVADKGYGGVERLQNT
ncbi:MAG: hypothetical protein QF809_04840, partial [Candidatus Peribacteraceae bacterium]|nr:hypothetical protein [Candidatus Peribacteraceae bacterium]